MVSCKSTVRFVAALMNSCIHTRIAFNQIDTTSIFLLDVRSFKSKTQLGTLYLKVQRNLFPSKNHKNVITAE